MNNIDTAVPPGFMRDAKGRLDPVSRVKPIDIERDKLVMEIVAKARALSSAIADFKRETFGDIAAFVQLSAEEYGAKVGGTKGNITLYSYDGRFKVLRAIQDRLVFDERLQAAKSLIDECIHEWSQGASPEIQALVNDAFQTDKAGSINTGRVLGLRRLDIKDEKWQRAMAALSDAVTVADSKSYIRVYERVGDSEEYRTIALDVAGA
ncbi:MAG: hypothetical protein AzoDbin1_04107 [Azoarcus sp.]|nr:hypothetical protein [Azoarcus sp.]